MQLTVVFILGVTSTVVLADQLENHFEELPRHALFYRETPVSKSPLQPINETSTTLVTQSQNVFNDSNVQRLSYKIGHHSPNCPDHPHHRPPPYPPTPPRCGGVFAGARAVLLSPNFPRPYPPFMECNYNVIPQTPVSREICFQVRFVHLSLRWSHNCELDWIQIDQGPRLCGSISGDRYYRTSPRGLVVEFHSGKFPGPEGSGFNLIVSQLPCNIFRPPPQPNPHPHHPPHQPHPPYYPPPNYPQPPHHPPPGHQCPPVRPGYPPTRPPGYYPPYYKSSHDEEPWWRWIWVLKCEWAGPKHLPPGYCPEPRPPVPGSPSPPGHGPQYPPGHKPYHPPGQGPYLPPENVPYHPSRAGCDRIVSSAQFAIDSDEWLPRLHPKNGPWNCQFRIQKAGPAACEVQLVLVSVNLRCATEYLLVGGERVCGEQPLRQMSVDFRGQDIKIIYQNLGIGDSSRPGSFEIRGYQNFDCGDITLEVVEKRKLDSISSENTTRTLVNPRIDSESSIQKWQETTTTERSPVYIHA